VTRIDGVAGGGEGANITPQPAVEARPSAAIFAALADLQTQRRFCIRAQQRSDRAVESFLERIEPQADREAAFAAARRLRLAIEAGKATHPTASLVLRAREARLGWDKFRADVETRMRQLARSLPVYDAFVRDVAGFADLGLAVIAAEARDDIADPANYPNPAKLWKHLGLAVMNGVRQGGLRKGASAEQWIAHGYNPERRSEVWVFCSDILVRHQFQKGKPRDPYGEAYARKKAEYLARGWTPTHADQAARRYMSKRFIRDLWAAWKHSVEPSAEMVEAMLAPRTGVREDPFDIAGEKEAYDREVSGK
jgi:hypothetical protein